MAEHLLKISIPAKANRLAMIRPAIRRAAEHCGFDDAVANDIVLATAEACQNIILHGYGGEPTGAITLCLKRIDNGIVVRLEDGAPAMDWVNTQPQPLDLEHPGGLGTYFLREIMDCIEYHETDSKIGNVVEMTKLKCEDA